MNRRRFIKGSILLLGLSITHPRKFIDTIAVLCKPRKSWKDKILDLYPDRNSPLLDSMKNLKPTGDPHFSWWRDTLK